MSMLLEKCHSPLLDLTEDAWAQLRMSLRPKALHFVRTMHIAAWRGQEEELAEDIVQETIRRAIERAQKAETGAMLPIYSLQKMMITIACNYCKDMRRRDKRVFHIGSDMSAVELPVARNRVVDCADVAIERVQREEVFAEIAQAIVRFPPKQRKAILIDIASRMSFDEEPTQLQQAFLAVGISLQEYRHLQLESLAAYTRHTSLLSYAYKRLVSCLAFKSVKDFVDIL